ncbi:MAG: hypothetical protein ABR885_17655 [Mycobacterium sp.]
MDVLGAVSVRLVHVHRHALRLGIDENAVHPQSAPGGEVDGDQPDLLADRHPMQGIALAGNGRDVQGVVGTAQEPWLGG